MYTFSVPSGLEDVSKYPVLIEELLKNKAWSEQDLKKLVGINFLRVFRQVETVKYFSLVDIFLYIYKLCTS